VIGGPGPALGRGLGSRAVEHAAAGSSAQVSKGQQVKNEVITLLHIERARMRMSDHSNC
jgi:hypothetical protein